MILPLCYADSMTPVSAETVQRLVTTTTSQVQVHWNPTLHKNPATMESNLILSEQVCWISWISWSWMVDSPIARSSM